MLELLVPDPAAEQERHDHQRRRQREKRGVHVEAVGQLAPVDTWRFLIDSPFGPSSDTQTAAPTRTAAIAQQVDDHERAVAGDAPPDLLAAFTEEKASLAGLRPGPDVPTPDSLLPT